MTAVQYRVVPARTVGWIIERRPCGLSGWMGWQPWGWRPSRRWAERLVRRCVRVDQSDADWDQYKRDHTFIFGNRNEP